MDKPKVTVITATYNLIKNNRKNYFIQALESVQKQSYDNIEHLIIDGGSDDGTITILEEYKKMGWIKYYSEPDDGIYYAFNKGIEKAEGKYICFLNSDDYYWDPNAIEKNVHALEKHRADFSYGDTYIEENGKLNLYKGRINKIFTRPFMHISMICSKDMLCRMGKFNTKFSVAADYNLILKCILQKQKMVYIPCCIGVYRLGGFSALDIQKTEEDRLNAMIDAFYPKQITRSDACLLSENIYPKTLVIYLITKLGFKMLFRHKLIQLRKKIVQIRFSKNKKYVKIFGITIIDISQEKKHHG